MQCTRSGSSTPLGRDPDMRWLQLLAHTRRNNPASLPGAMSPSSSTSSLPMACSNLNNGGRVRSRSSATSYFALLSVTEDAHQHERQVGRKQHYNGSGTPTGRHIDPSWVAWLNARGHHQHRGGPVGDSTHSTNGAGQYSSGQSCSPSEPPVQLQPQTLPDSTVMPSSFLSTSAFTTTTSPSTISSAATPFPPPQAPLTDAEIDALIQQFPDFADGLRSGFPDTANEMGPFDPAEADAGLTTWLNEQHAFAFNLGEDVPVSQSKRGLTLEGYPGEMSADGTGWEGGIKKLKVYHEEYNGSRK